MDEGLLSHYRVIDLTDERGQLAGAMLAQLGADVILVEAPGGSPSRRVGTLVEDTNATSCSLGFWAVNRGKSSVILDLELPDDRQRLRNLAAGADVLIESGAPGALSSLDLGYDDLAAS